MWRGCLGSEPIFLLYNRRLNMKCFLCEKNNVEMSLEHSIPQFLGGKKSDDKFKRLNLCKSCNSKLGTHVDARFARSFINSMELIDFNDDVFFGRFTSIEFENSDEIHDLISENNYVEMMSNDKAVAFWIKENTPDFLGLVGGHPPLSKSKDSQLFFFITKEDMSEVELKKLLNDIKDKFKKYKRLQILLCLEFSNNQEMNESELNLFHGKIKEIFNIAGLKFIWEFSEKEIMIKNRLRPDDKYFRVSIPFDLNDDVRFLTKLFLGVLCGYLGNEFTDSSIGIKLANILKTYLPRAILSEEDMRRLKHPFQMKGDNLFLFEENAITISIIQIREDILGLLGIGKNKYVLKICNKQELPKGERNILNINSDSCKIPEGVTLVLKKNSNKYIEYDTKKFFLDKFFEIKCPGLPEEEKLKIIQTY